MKLNINQLIKFKTHRLDKLTKLTLSTTVRASDLPVNKYTERSHTCGQLTLQDVGKRVNLFGWVQYARFDNKIIALRDSYGVVQCVMDSSLLTKSFRKTPIHNESVVHIEGVVKERPASQKMSSKEAGDIEVAAEHVYILSHANKDLPILTRDSSAVNSENRLKYRYLDLRSQEMQNTLRFRSQVCNMIRTILIGLNFVECETPTLFNRTPGGANEFIVPTQLAGQFYSLVQSPQQLKQLLMISGLDRYFQICRCYRDESGRADRQPEFTQVDIELSFTSQDLVIRLIEDLMYNLLCNISSDSLPLASLTSSFDSNHQLKRISYQEAFDRYGTDKPDTRYSWYIEATTSGGLHLKVPHTFESCRLKQIIEDATASLESHVAQPQIDFSINAPLGQVEVFSKDETEVSRKLLGRIRSQLAKELEARGTPVYDEKFGFIWVTDFPLFTTDENGKLESNHHPFTAPTQETVQFLKTEPLKVVGQHYDLVLNGQEVAGGSIRIHDADLQREIFSDLLKVDDRTFDYFLEALTSGCPPHGGIAIGLDRLISILMHKESIKDVIAFPKTNSGRDLMTKCPHELAAEVKQLYHIK